MFGLFSTSTTSSFLFVHLWLLWPFLFSSKDMTAHIPLVMYSVHIPRQGNLFCTYGIFLWFLYTYPTLVHFMSSFIYCCLLWSFLYIYLFLMSFLYGWYLHLDIPLVTYSIRKQNVCTLLIFIGYFVHLLFLGEPIFTWEIFMTMCPSFWWPILYTHTHTYHEDLCSSDFYGLFHLFLPSVLILTYFMVIVWWPILYTYFYLGDLFCTSGFFKG